jgi:hypothetical protein
VADNPSETWLLLPQIVLSGVIAGHSLSLEAGGDILPRQSCVALPVDVKSLAQDALALIAAARWTSALPLRWRQETLLPGGVPLPVPGVPLPPATKRVTFQELPLPIGTGLFRRLAKAGWAKSIVPKI